MEIGTKKLKSTYYKSMMCDFCDMGRNKEYIASEVGIFTPLHKLHYVLSLSAYA
jgi:hypothetical protein